MIGIGIGIGIGHGAINLAAAVDLLAPVLAVPQMRSVYDFTLAGGQLYQSINGATTAATTAQAPDIGGVSNLVPGGDVLRVTSDDARAVLSALGGINGGAMFTPQANNIKLKAPGQLAGVVEFFGLIWSDALAEGCTLIGTNVWRYGLRFGLTQISTQNGGATAATGYSKGAWVLVRYRIFTDATNLQIVLSKNGGAPLSGPVLAHGGQRPTTVTYSAQDGGDHRYLQAVHAGAVIMDRAATTAEAQAIGAWLVSLLERGGVTPPALGGFA
jgi:hypothetical protein